MCYLISSEILFPVLGFATALCLSVYAIPIIIKIAVIHKLYDRPGGRKAHKRFVPNLGGIAIFAGVVFSLICWMNFSDFPSFEYLILGLIILHLLGVKDDVTPLSPYKKLIGQIVAAAVLVVPGEFRINELHGVFGLYHISTPISVSLSVFAIILLINSFNLIDGTDGLAAGIALLVSLAFSYIFWQYRMNNVLIATLALAGALVGFLFYNRQPAKIFMGDAGSMCIGYLMAAFGVIFMKANAEIQHVLFNHNPGVLIAFFIVPLFDTLRVFTVRIFHRRSPFEADNNHIHHKLLELGYSHGKVAITLTLTDLGFIGMAYFASGLSPSLLIVLILVLAGALTSIPLYLVQKRKANIKTSLACSQFVSKSIYLFEFTPKALRSQKTEITQKSLSEINSD